MFSAGISTPASPSLRSEYFNIEESVVEHLIDAALKYKWDQFYLPDLILASPEYNRLCGCARAKGLDVLVRDISMTYAVQLQGNSFSEYLKSLSGNTRLKLYNKRNALYKLGEIKITNLWPDFETFIRILNEFHERRWGKPCYSGRNLEQITWFIKEISRVGGVPNLSVIYCDDLPVSAVFDLEYLGRIYNIQSGYIERFQNGISLGTLHFGFQLENAFRSDATHYDFMAGKGKSHDYKKALATHSENLVTIMLVRNPLLKCLYVIKDFINRFKFS